MFWAWMAVGFVVFVAIGFWREGKETAQQHREILRLLWQADRSALYEMMGLELVRFSNGVLKRGTVYVRLARLVEDGLVVERRLEWEYHVQLPRFAYRLTDAGRALAEEMFP